MSAATGRFFSGLARAVGGALLFALPLWMTEETWHLGYTVDPGRLALFVALTCPFLVALSHVSGFEPTVGLVDDVVDAAVAWAVGFATGAAGMALLGLFGSHTSWREGTGRLALLAVPGSIGALLAQSQFNTDDGGLESSGADDGTGEGGDEKSGRPSTYASQLLVMLAGAVFLAFNIAPTHEVELVALVITPWHALALVGVSLAAMHGFVYALHFTGDEPLGPGTPAWSAFARYTLPGYAVALGVAALVLWTFGRFVDTDAAVAVRMLVVLGFPSAVGAAAARVIL